MQDKAIDVKPNAIVGKYDNQEYSGSDKNDWHYVTISTTDNPMVFEWKNKAGVSWTLEFNNSDPTNFQVGKSCPYYTDGHIKANVKSEGEYVVGIRGPGNEFYTKVPDFGSEDPLYAQT